MSPSRRDQILDIATALFATRGYRHTTLDAIAGELNLGKTAIYHYFDGKEAVFSAAIERISDQLVQVIREAIAELDDPTEILATIVRTRFEVLARLTQQFDISEAIAEELGPLSQAARGSYFEAEEKLLAEALRLGAARGVFEIQSPQLEARLISAMLRGTEAMLTLGDRREETEAYLEVFLRLLMKGLRAAPAPAD